MLWVAPSETDAAANVQEKCLWRIGEQFGITVGRVVGSFVGIIRQDHDRN